MKLIQTMFTVVLGTMFYVASASAQAPASPPPTPVKVTGVEIVTPEAARALLGKATFFDMRSAVNFGKGHLTRMLHKQSALKRLTSCGI